LNDSIVPTKGFTFITNAAFNRNFTEKDFLQKYDARLQAYIPLNKKFSLAVRVGGATVSNNSPGMDAAQVYQYAVIGGAPSLRGYRIERFWGKTSFYNNNELRFITDLKTYLVNGKIGFLAFFDDGRVWIPNENSNVLHTSYGGGILIAPFHFACVTVTYGISKETKLFQVRINTSF
jgi:outer membrane protein assembly factor BamA